jgi:formylglycine-generating enzyme required for sulfatase activity
MPSAPKRRRTSVGRRLTLLLASSTPAGYRPAATFDVAPLTGAVPAPPVARPAAPARGVPALDDCVPLAAGAYTLGEPGEERVVEVREVLVARYPVTNAHYAAFAEATGRQSGAKLADPELADHPATDVTFADAEAFCVWASARLGATARLPDGDEWEAAARSRDARPWPWGPTFDPERCNCAEAAWGWTVPVRSHPTGAGPCGAEQLAGNVWEWVADPPDADGWRTVRGGCYLDHAWGLRASRALPADPARATATTGFRIVIDIGSPT